MNRRELLRSASLLGAAGLLPRSMRAALPLPVAQTTYGPVEGRIVDEGILCFKGIRYGADTALTRFAPPARPLRWTHVHEAAAWGPRAPQLGGAHGASPAPDTEYHLPPDEGTESEDCLHLNVWTPALRNTERDHKSLRPVMVYIHGGAYSNGTANSRLYDGTHLAHRGDAVIVTVNHRLNLFGYLYLAELLPGQGFEDSGNAGQLDLVLALQWVHDNIAVFGGDPARVTIFGQSGGGAKCATLMAQPPAAGLFHRVITMSGQQVTGAQPAHATERARAVLAALGLSGMPPASAAAALRSVPTDKLKAAIPAGGYYGPVVDGRSLPVDPFSPTDPQQSSAVPMLMGNTRDETRLLLGGNRPELFALTWETLPAALERDAPFLKSATVTLPVAEVIAKYREWHPTFSASDVFFAVTTDSRSWRGEVIEAERRAADPLAQPRTWVYQLNFRSGVDHGRFGAPHTLDIPLAFDNATYALGMVGATPVDIERARQMAETVSNTFLAFARTGNPNQPQLAPWPAYDLMTRATMLFDIPSRVEDDPRGAERVYLGQVPYTQPGT